MIDDSIQLSYTTETVYRVKLTVRKGLAVRFADFLYGLTGEWAPWGSHLEKEDIFIFEPDLSEEQLERVKEFIKGDWECPD